MSRLSHRACCFLVPHAGHTFCLACIRQYLQTATRRRCPLCNADVPAGALVAVAAVRLLAAVT